MTKIVTAPRHLPRSHRAEEQLESRGVAFVKSTKLFGGAVAIAFVFAFSVIPLQADIVFGTDNDNQNVENILFNQIWLADQANTVQGISQTGFVVDFYSTEALETTAGGQARIQALDGGTYSDLLIDLNIPGATFLKAVFNINAASDGNVLISVLNSAGQTESASFAVDGNGENYFTITAVNGQLIDTISLAASTGFTLDITDTRQIRMGGFQVVPEPGFYGVLAVGMSGLFWFAYRRKQLVS